MVAGCAFVSTETRRPHASAHRLSEVAAIYPITPASPMGELADAWSAERRPNLWGTVPEVIEMQSEAGAAAVLHGALQRGALVTTFTASQGLLLMIPSMFKIAGELLPCVFHVAARAIATHALSIFGDHSDVMAARTTGFAMLASSSVQEAHDFALVAHATTLCTRIPFLHFFDGFRTSHEIHSIELLSDDDLAALVGEDMILAHRARRLSPDRPVLRGTAQNPDVFFQSREACNPFYAEVPRRVAESFARLAERTGRTYQLVDYVGSPDAERVLVLMGSGVGAACEVVESLCAAGERVGVLIPRLYRPFPLAAFTDAIPPTTRALAVLDRTKEPGSAGEPLYQDVLTACVEGSAAGGRLGIPRIIGGRYGLGSKEFTPGMVKAVFDELGREKPKNHFTIGIHDDVSHTSLSWDRTFRTEGPGVQAVSFGLGSDGSVGAAKSSVKIIGEQTGLFAQGYFVYDSKKSGAVTVSHLRFGPAPIRSTYQIEHAELVACHHESFLSRIDVLGRAAPRARFLLNSPHPPTEVWDRLPGRVQRTIREKELELWVVDAHRVAREVGLAGRINTVMQPCFFALCGVLPREQALSAIRQSIEKVYAKRGKIIVERNIAAVDRALGALQRVEVPADTPLRTDEAAWIAPTAPEFVRRVTARLLAGEGDLLPVSALPWMAPFRRAPRASKSGCSPSRFPSGTLRSVLTAESVPSPVPTLQFA